MLMVRFSVRNMVASFSRFIVVARGDVREGKV